MRGLLINKLLSFTTDVDDTKYFSTDFLNSFILEKLNKALWFSKVSESAQYMLVLKE